MQNTEYVKDNLSYETNDNKVIEFMKKYVLDFLIALVILIFLFKDLIEIEKSGKTLVEIIANSIVNLIVGQLIKNLFAEKGTNAGFMSPSYVRMNKRYGEEIDKCDSKLDQLDDFCDKKNEQRIIKVQKHILRPARIKYEDFMTKEKYDVCKNKTQEKIWEKAMNVKIQMITPENLVSETDSRYEKGKKEESLKVHKAKNGAKGFIIAALLGVIFGYFVPALNNNALAGLLWNLVQVAIWLAFGIITYYQEYRYITVDYSQRVLRKITYLVEFNNEKGDIENGTNN